MRLSAALFSLLLPLPMGSEFGVKEAREGAIVDYHVYDRLEEEECHQATALQSQEDT